MGMYEIVCEEIDRIAQKGLNSGNLDTAFKLIDMKKDLVTIESMEGSIWHRDEAAEERDRTGRIREAMLNAGMTEQEVDIYMRKLQ